MMGVNGTVRDLRASPARTAGVTLIEILLAIALLAVITALALPVYSNYSIRTKIGESLEIANDTKMKVVEACRADRPIDSLNAELGSRFFVRRAARQPYVREIRFSGSCESPVITITAGNTGQTPNPVLTWSAIVQDEPGQMTWLCKSENTSERRLPKDCRN